MHIMAAHPAKPSDSYTLARRLLFLVAVAGRPTGAEPSGHPSPEHHAAYSSSGAGLRTRHPLARPSMIKAGAVAVAAPPSAIAGATSSSAEELWERSAAEMTRRARRGKVQLPVGAACASAVAVVLVVILTQTASAHGSMPPGTLHTLGW